MHVKIIKPDTVLFEGEVSILQLPGTDGVFEILERHAPIIASLTAGHIRLVGREGEQAFQIKAGVVKGQQNQISVLVQ